MKDYRIKLKLVLKTSFLQSGKNKRELEKKISDVVIKAIENDKVLNSLFDDENKPKISMKIKKIKK